MSIFAAWLRWTFVTITALPEALNLEAFVPEPAFRLDSGRSLYVTKEPLGELVRVVGADGRLELSVVLTNEGPVLRMRAVSLTLEAEEIGLEANKIRLAAKQALSLESEGQLEETVRGKRSSTVLGSSISQARDHRLVASSGEVQVRAAGDVRVNGENVLLNC